MVIVTKNKHTPPNNRMQSDKVMGAITYREMIFGEEQVVFDLVEKVFTEFVAPDYQEEGIKEFVRFLNPIKLRQRV